MNQHAVTAGSEVVCVCVQFVVLAVKLGRRLGIYSFIEITQKKNTWKNEYIPFVQTKTNHINQVY